MVGLLLSVSACGGPTSDGDGDGGSVGDASTRDAAPLPDGAAVDGGVVDDDGGSVEPDAYVRAEPLACEVAEGGCDEVITSADGAWIPIRDRHIPGRTICLAAGEYSQLYLENVTGEEGSPVTIINCGGRVVFDTEGQQVGIQGRYVEHLHITGTGDPSIEYGIEEHSADLHGISFDEGITDIEIDHVEIHDVEWVGIGVRSYPRCDGMHNRSNWTQYDTNIHHNYLHDVLNGEGMYIGTSHYDRGGGGYLSACPDLGYMEPPLRRVHVYDNILEDIGADGIQVGAAIEDMEITRNIVRRYARTQDPGDLGGLQINPGSVGLVHDNWIEAFAEDGVGTAIQYAGGDAGDIEIYDNVIITPAVALMTLGHMIGPAHRTIIRDNTIVSLSGTALVFYCNPDLSPEAPHEMSMTGNIFVGYARIGPFVFNDGTDDWFHIFGSSAAACPINGHVYPNSREPDLEVPGNFWSREVTDAEFVDAAASDYRLQPGSPAEGMGATLD